MSIALFQLFIHFFLIPSCKARSRTQRIYLTFYGFIDIYPYLSAEQPFFPQPLKILRSVGVQKCIISTKLKFVSFVTLQFVIITQFVIHYKLRWIATQFVIPSISNCVARATRFVMYYKLRQNFIILKYWKRRKTLINCKMHRLNNILLWIQLDTNIFELGMQNSQSTLHLVRTLFCTRTFAKLGRGALKPILPSVYWFVCPSLCLSQNF